MSDNEMLKPCPFCGGEAELITKAPEAYVHCLACSATSDSSFVPGHAAKQWNRRAAASAEPVAWWCVNYPGGGGALTPIEDVVLHWRSQGLDVVPLYTHPAPDAEIVAALEAMLDEYDRNVCEHEITHRGGHIWTICEGCGRKWADDEGGFVPHSDPPHVVAARAALAKAKGGSQPASTTDDRYNGTHAFPDEN